MSEYSEKLKRFKEKPWVKPIGVVLAFPEAHEVNEVLIAGHLRYRLTRQLTRAEFMAQIAENNKYADRCAAVGTMDGSKIDTEGTSDQPEPGPEFTYFYAAECI